MANWRGKGDSAVLTLSGSFQTIQQDSADLELLLNPAELVQMIFEFNPQASATENCEIIIPKTVDASVWETDGQADRYIMLHTNRESDDPARWSREYAGVYGVKIRARLLDTDGTPGGTDTTSTLKIHYNLDGF